MKIPGCLLIFLLVVSVFSQPQIRFLDKESAEAAIVADSLVSYFTRLPSWEMIVKTGRAAVLNPGEMTDKDCREAFSKGVREFTEEDKEIITRYVAVIDSFMPVEFPALAAIPWSFILLCDSLEAGFPDTRDGHVILSEKFLRALNEWKDKQSSMFFVGLEVLIHEKVHVLQRINPAKFEQFYLNTWGFRKVAIPKLHDLIQERILVDPDAPSHEWVINLSPNKSNFILPAVILKDNRLGMGENVQRIGISIDSTKKGFLPRMNKSGRPEFRDLNSVSQYRKKFPLSEHDYHPHELSADLVSKYLVRKFVSDRYGTAAARAGDFSQIDLLVESFSR